MFGYDTPAGLIDLGNGKQGTASGHERFPFLGDRSFRGRAQRVRRPRARQNGPSSACPIRERHDGFVQDRDDLRLGRPLGSISSIPTKTGARITTTNGVCSNASPAARRPIRAPIRSSSAASITRRPGSRYGLPMAMASFQTTPTTRVRASRAIRPPAPAIPRTR